MAKFSRKTNIRIAAASILSISAIAGVALESLGIAGSYMALGAAATMLLPGAALACAAWLYFKLFGFYKSKLKEGSWRLSLHRLPQTKNIEEDPVPVDDNTEVVREDRKNEETIDPNEARKIWAKMILSSIAIPFALAPLWLPIFLEFTTSLNVFSTVAWPWLKAIENLGFIASADPFKIILALSIGTAAGVIVTGVFLFYKGNAKQHELATYVPVDNGTLADTTEKLTHESPGPSNSSDSDDSNDSDVSKGKDGGLLYDELPVVPGTQKPESRGCLDSFASWWNGASFFNSWGRPAQPQAGSEQQPTTNNDQNRLTS